MLELEYTLMPKEAQAKLMNAQKIADQRTIRVAIITFAYYIPSYDMVVSVLMEIRFDDAGSVRSRSLDVSPIQIYTPGNATDDYVL